MRFVHILLVPVVLCQDFASIFSSLFKTRTSRVEGPLQIEIFGESQCSDTSAFMKTQLSTVWDEIISDPTISFIYHPFGVKSSCTQKHSYGLSCQCQHGPFECLLNQLQSCVISALQAPELYMPTVTCIQGKRSITSAIEDCIENANPRPNLDAVFMARCAQSELGKKLMLQHAIVQKKIAPEIDWVPWIMLNGERNAQAEYTLRGELCKYKSKFC